jgi:hypothetical protein
MGWENWTDARYASELKFQKDKSKKLEEQNDIRIY